MSKIKLFITSFVGIIITVVIIGVISFSYINHAIYSSYGESGSVKEFAVASGEGVKSVSYRLEEDDLISSDFIFQIYVWQQNAGSKIKAGDYEIPTGMNMPAILDLLVGGKVKINTIQITFPEGFNSQQILARITNYLPAVATALPARIDTRSVSGRQAGELRITNYDLIVSNPPKELKDSYWFLNDDKIKNLEGYLFPDTYKFDVEVSAEDIVKKMLDNFKKKIDPLREQIESNKMSLYEILTLASIVEKEVSSVDDMRIVSGLFLHRLEIGMYLQSDATVNYITNKGMPSPIYKDLEIDSPYNTYQYAGLPPGPICNPGINAIKAVLDPQRTDYLFFLTPAGKPTVYSKTFAEHEANKQKWLK